MDIDVSSSRDYISTSSTSFRIDFTSKFACDIYDARLAYIRAKRDPCYDGVKHDFKNHTQAIRQLRELELFASAQAVDANSASQFQRARYQNLLQEKRTIRYARIDSLISASKKLWVFQDNLSSRNYTAGYQFPQWKLSDSFASPTRLDSTRIWDLSCWSESTDKEKQYFDNLEQAITDLEVRVSTEKGVRLRKSLLDSNMVSYIAQAAISRADDLEKQLQKQITNIYSSSLDYESKVERCLLIKECQAEVPGILAQFDNIQEEFITEMTSICRKLGNAQRKMEGFASYAISFQRYKKWCRRDADFAQGLSHFTGPFRFLAFPREIRDLIYGHLLSCNHTVLAERCYDWRYTSKKSLWVHPLFHTSRQVRKEAAKYFYGRNSFAAQSLSSIWSWKISPEFRSLVTKLSLTWTSLDNTSYKLIKELKLFASLRVLKIYLNFQQLDSVGSNNSRGISAFEEFLYNFKYEVRSVQDIDFFAVKLSYKENQIMEDLSVEWRTQTPFIYPDFALDPNPRPVQVRKRNIFPGIREPTESLSRAMSIRILNPQCPNSGRPPRIPSLRQAALDLKNKGKAERKGIAFVPVVRQIDEREVASELKEIKKTVAAMRAENMRILARDMEQMEQQRAEHAIQTATQARADAERRVHEDAITTKMKAQSKAWSDAMRLVGFKKQETAQKFFEILPMNKLEDAARFQDQAKNEALRKEAEIARAIFDLLPMSDNDIITLPTVTDTSALEAFWSSFDGLFDDDTTDNITDNTIDESEEGTDDFN